MAENEVLDVGNPRHFRRWRKALANNLSHSEVAECLSEDYSMVLRKKLRGEPLYLVLKACGSDRKALQEVVVNFKERALAKLVEQAHAITGSNDPLVVARKMAELQIDSLVGQATRYAFKHDHNADGVRHAALERAALARLEACKPEIISPLIASLRGDPIPRLRKAHKVRPSAESLLATSLRPLAT